MIGTQRLRESLNDTVDGEGGRKYEVSMRQYPDVASLDWCNFAIEGRNEGENNANDCLKVNRKAGAYPSDVGVGFEASRLGHRSPCYQRYRLRRRGNDGRWHAFEERLAAPAINWQGIASVSICSSVKTIGEQTFKD